MDDSKNKGLQKIPKRCQERVRGMLFFDRKFDVTQNKTEFIYDTNPFWRAFTQTTSDDKLCKKYADWLAKCHKLDHEAIFGDVEKYNAELNQTTYKSVAIGDVTFRLGDHVVSCMFIYLHTIQRNRIDSFGSCAEMGRQMNIRQLRLT